MNETFRQRVQDELTSVNFDLAIDEDIDELNGLLEKFVMETGYARRGIVYSAEKSRQWLERVIPLGVAPHILAKRDGRIIGFLSYTLDSYFCERPIAVLNTIWVAPEHRRGPVGRALLAFAIDSARSVDEAVAFHAPIASELPDVPSLRNLFRHAGFDDIGLILGRAL